MTDESADEARSVGARGLFAVTRGSRERLTSLTGGEGGFDFYHFIAWVASHWRWTQAPLAPHFEAQGAQGSLYRWCYPRMTLGTRGDGPLVEPCH